MNYRVSEKEFVDFLGRFFNDYEGYKGQRLGQAFHNTFHPSYLMGTWLDNALFHESDNAKAIDLITSHFVRYE